MLHKQGMVRIYFSKILESYSVTVIAEAKHFVFGAQIDRVEYQLTHDRLLLNVACSGSCDLFKFW